MRRDEQVKGDVVVITSYDTLRNEIDFLGKFNFCYCVLDEGHVIKNGKSKTTQAVLSHLTHRVIEVVLQKSIPTQIRQLILHVENSEE
jgi:TATA-binding protein-associated factor